MANAAAYRDGQRLAVDFLQVQHVDDSPETLAYVACWMLAILIRKHHGKGDPLGDVIATIANLVHEVPAALGPR